MKEAETFPRTTRWIRKIRQDKAGVTSLEYAILFGGVGFLIVLGSFNYIAPGISDRLGNAFNPEVVLSAGLCPAYNKGAKETPAIAASAWAAAAAAAPPTKARAKIPAKTKRNSITPARGTSEA